MKTRAAGWKHIAGIVMAGLLVVPAFGAPRIPPPDTRAPAQVGTVNYIEGQVAINGTALNQNSVGTTLEAGQTLATTNGRAEILLTPGVLLRLDNGSAVHMDSPALENIVVTLTQGRALVEADEILKDNNIVINENGFGVKITKKGLYEFDATAGQVRVFDGQAEVIVDKKKIEIPGGHELAFSQDKLKARGFDKKAYEDDFYRWASLRSSYLAEANVSTARLYVNGGPGWYGPAWYWSPWFGAYTWIPGDGIFWGPFGWGFFSPWYVGYAPLYFGYGYGFAPYYHTFGPAYHPPAVVARPFAAPRSGYVGGGFHSGFAGGGFHDGFAGGGFHGGGFGGGRR